MDSSRFVFSVLWGGGVFILYLFALVCRWLLYRRHHDSRSFRDVLEAFSLFGTAAGAALAIAVVIVWPEGDALRALMTSIALGGFVGAGIIMAGDAWATLRRR